MSQPPAPVAVMDIGGTHARFAVATVGRDGLIELGEAIKLRTADHVSFETAWEAFQTRLGGVAVRNISMAIAGQATGELIRFTNNPWTIRRRDLHGKLGIERITIINDFAAVAHAAARCDDSQFMHLCGPDQPLGRHGTISVIGPGTGLGAAHIWRAGADYRVQATEAGHIDFAPLDRIEDAILARLRERHLRVSAERVVSGPAITDIYHTLAEIEGRAVRAQDAIAIWTAGQDGSDTLAAAAIERFCLSLGSVAGDIVLAQGGFAGVVIAGGLGYRIRDTLKASGFAQRFCAKGRFASLMASIPVKLITHPEPGLFGAAAAFAKEHEEAL
ncbi:MAG: glucokinase [Erythrobacter sp.]